MCRIRPENKIEKEGNYQKCVTYEDYQITVNVWNTFYMRFCDFLHFNKLLYIYILGDDVCGYSVTLKVRSVIWQVSILLVSIGYSGHITGKLTFLMRLLNLLWMVKKEEYKR